MTTRRTRRGRDGGHDAQPLTHEAINAAMVEIFRACDEETGPRDAALLDMATGTYLRACGRCGHAAGKVRRRLRKLQLAARPRDCARCGRKPSTWTLAGWKLCGRCKTATAREHARAMAEAGALAIFATACSSTPAWAAARPPLPQRRRMTP